MDGFERECGKYEPKSRGKRCKYNSDMSAKPPSRNSAVSHLDDVDDDAAHDLVRDICLAEFRIDKGLTASSKERMASNHTGPSMFLQE